MKQKIKSYLKAQNITPLAFLFIASCASPFVAEKGQINTNEYHSLVGAYEKILKEQPSGKYKSEESHTSLIWKVGHLGLSNYTAKFSKISAELDFNSSEPEKSKVIANIDPLSVSTGLPNFDKEIGEKLFESKPIIFKSTSLTPITKTKAKMIGDLEFHGITKPVELIVTFNGGTIYPFSTKRAIGFSAHGYFKRSDFGVTQYIPLVGDEVEISIEAEFIKE